MSEPEGGEAQGQPDIIAANVFLPAGGRRGRQGPDPKPMLWAAIAGASLIGVAAVLLRGLKLGLEEGFFEPRLAGEMVAWAMGAALIAGLVLAFVIAPRKGLKLKAPHYLTLAAATLGVTALAALWIGFPSPAQRMERKATMVAMQARDDSIADIIAFKAQARALQWAPRVAPGEIDKEKDLLALRKVITDTAEVINEYKTRLAKRRQNIRTLLDVAAPNSQDRAKVQAIYENTVGDLAAQEDRYWDQQAEAMNKGIELVDGTSYLRNWEEAQARGYPVRIDRAAFNKGYARHHERLTELKSLVAETEKKISQPGAK